jgi:hypothetical protein
LGLLLGHEGQLATLNFLVDALPHLK